MFLKKFENFDNNFCVYIFLNPSKPGEYKYDEYKFDFEPSKSLMGHEGYGKGIARSQDVKDKIRLSVSGDKNHFFGKTHTDELKNKLSIKNTGKNNPNSKLYRIEHNGEILTFEGRLELKEYLNKFNIDNNLKGPNRVSFDNLINRGYSKDFKLLSIDKLN